jgi:hypothetical protein
MQMIQAQYANYSKYSRQDANSWNRQNLQTNIKPAGNENFMGRYLGVPVVQRARNANI